MSNLTKLSCAMLVIWGFQTKIVLAHNSVLPKTSAPLEYSYKELVCLTLTVLGEAGGVTYTSAAEQRRVVYVVLARVKDRRYPNTICGVVSQRLQFQGYERVLEKPYPPSVVTHYIRVMKKILENKPPKLNWHATHFYGVKHKKPYWAKTKPIICSKWHCYLRA